MSARRMHRMTDMTGGCRGNSDFIYNVVCASSGVWPVVPFGAGPTACGVVRQAVWRYTSMAGDALLQVGATVTEWTRTDDTALEVGVLDD